MSSYVADEGAQFSGRSKVVRVLKLIKRRLWFTVLLGLLVAGYLMLSAYDESFLYATNYVALNYENAANGLYPNGTRLNMYDMKDLSVMERAIELAGLTGQIAPQALADSLTIQPRYTRAPKEGYIGTEYRLQLEIKNRYGHIDAKNLLSMVCKAYSEKFHEEFTYNQQALELEETDLQPLDYLDILSVLRAKAAQLDDYLLRRKSENSIYRSALTGETFSSLRQQLGDYSNVMLSDFNAYVIDNGLTKDAQKYQAMMNYRLSSLKESYERSILEFDIRVKTITEYDAAQSATVLVPTKDRQDIFYMSKTKMGMDYLATDASDFVSTAKDKQLQIDTINLRLSKVLKGGMNQSTADKAEQMIASLNAELEHLYTLARQVDNEYVLYTDANSITTTETSLSFMEAYGLKRAFMGFLATFVAVIALRYYIDCILHGRKKKRKRI